MTLAVWDAPERNPWATVPSSAVQALGVVPAPDPTVPGPFSMSADGQLEAALHAAGFVEVTVDAVAVERHNEDFDDFLGETLNLSHLFARAWGEISDDQQQTLIEELSERAAPFTLRDGTLEFPGVSLVALAHA
jgi:hypothetical protein